MSASVQNETIRVEELLSILSDTLSANSRLLSAIGEEQRNLSKDYAAEVDKLRDLVYENLDFISLDTIDDMNRRYPENLYACKMREIEPGTLSLTRSGKVGLNGGAFQASHDKGKVPEKLKTEAARAAAALVDAQNDLSVLERFFTMNHPEVDGFNKRYPQSPLTSASLNVDYEKNGRPVWRAVTLLQSETPKVDDAYVGEVENVLAATKDIGKLAEDFRRLEKARQVYVQAGGLHDEIMLRLAPFQEKTEEQTYKPKTAVKVREFQKKQALTDTLPQAAAYYMIYHGGFFRMTSAWPAKAQVQAKESLIRIYAYNKLKDYLAAEEMEAKKLGRSLWTQRQKANDPLLSTKQHAGSNSVAQLKLLEISQDVHGSYMNVNGCNFRAAVAALRLDSKEAQTASARYATTGQEHEKGARSLTSYMLWSCLVDGGICDKSFVRQCLSISVNTFPAELLAPSEVNVEPDYSRHITQDHKIALERAGFIGAAKAKTPTVFGGAASQVTTTKQDGDDLANGPLAPLNGAVPSGRKPDKPIIK